MKRIILLSIIASNLLAVDYGVYKDGIKIVSDYPFADKKSLSKSMGGDKEDIASMQDGVSVIVFSPVSSKENTNPLNTVGQEYRKVLLSNQELIDGTTLKTQFDVGGLQTPDADKLKSVYEQLANCTYSCPSGFILGGGAYCLKSATCSSGVLTNDKCVFSSTETKTANNNPTYSCPSGGLLNGTLCNVAATGYPATLKTSYSCPTGGTLSGTSCLISSTETYAATATPNYSCPSGGTLNGSTCTISSSSTYTAIPVLAGYTISSSCTFDVSGITGLQKNGNSFRLCQNGACSAYTYLKPNGQLNSNIAVSYVFLSNSGSGIVAGYNGTGTGAVTYMSNGSITNSSTAATPYGPTGLTRIDGNSFRYTYFMNQTGPAISWVPFYSGYSCPNGGTLSGTTCTVTSSSSYTATNTPTYSCPNGGTLSGTTCTKTVTSSLAALATQYYECSTGTLYGNTCQTAAAYSYNATKTDHYFCDAGFVLNGAICSKTVSTQSNPICSSGIYNATEDACVAPKICNR